MAQNLNYVTRSQSVISRVLSASIWFLGDGYYQPNLCEKPKMQSSFSTFSSHLRNKPPNILVYCGEDNDHNKSLFEYIKSFLFNCINTDAYTVYRLMREDVSASPWSENAALVVNCCEQLSECEIKHFLHFCTTCGGNFISFGCSQIDNIFVDIQSDVDEVQDCDIQVSDCESKIICPTSSQYKIPQYISRSVSFINEANLLLTFTSKPYYLNLQNMDGKFYGERGFKFIHEQVLGRCNYNQQPVVIKLCGENNVIILSVLLPYKMLIKQNADNLDVSKENIDIWTYIFSNHMNINCDSHQIRNHTKEINGNLFCRTKHLEKLNSMYSLYGELKRSGKMDRLDLCFLDPAINTADNLECQDIPIFLHGDKWSISEGEKMNFTPNDYFNNLSDGDLGWSIIHFEHVTSTMDVCCQLLSSKLSEHAAGIVIVSSYQSQASGRSNNQWISPLGSLAFSVIIPIRRTSKLGQRLPFLQHLAALATTAAIRNLPNCEEIDIGVKWPNDIYYGRTCKIGGVLVKSNSIGNQIMATIGIGINLDNQLPTTSLRNIVREYCHEHHVETPRFNKEVMLGLILSELHKILMLFNDGSSSQVLTLYYKHWLHSNQEVKIHDGSTVYVKGIDDYGFLIVNNKNGETFTVQPDGNSFDMMHNLIKLKK